MMDAKRESDVLALESKSTTDLNNNVGLVCSENCYKQENNNIDRNIIIWTTSDQFKVMNITLNSTTIDYCLIAKDFEGKSCFEVHEFAKNLKLFRYDKGPRDSRTQKQIELFFVKRNGSKRLISLETSLYTPCSHEGSCEEENCPCYAGKIYCEIYCSCQRNCVNKFPGCACNARCETKRCPCVVAVRACNPKECGSRTCVDGDHQCLNIPVQSLQAKKLEVKLSTKIGIGFGAFAREPIKRNEFIIVCITALLLILFPTHERSSCLGILGRVSYAGRIGSTL
jgi:hypothetical protein